METAVKTLKDEVIERISESEDLEMLQGVRRVLDYYFPKPMTEEQLQAKLERAREAARRGDVISHQELEAELTAWRSQRK